MTYDEIIERYTDAKEIWQLTRMKKMNKKESLLDWVVALFTPAPGIVDEADAFADMGNYLLVIKENETLLLRQDKHSLTEEKIEVDPRKRKFTFNGNTFIKTVKVYG